ncbi:MAG: hypothetical protein QOD06_2615 [Candidatus Binatota bacterium]|nr:hypothetical protein [Candidatus Binatota bacterium]
MSLPDHVAVDARRVGSRPASHSGGSRWSWLPYLVLLLALALTAVATSYAWTNTQAEERARFDLAVESASNAISERIETCVAILRGAAGLFAASEYVEWSEFQAYVERLDLQRRYPGVRGVGFSERVTIGDAAAFVARARREVAPGFHLWPNPQSEELQAVLYIYPTDRRNLAALGYDMASDPTRLAAMEEARDRGVPIASGNLTLVQETDGKKQQGFLIYLPVYRGARIPAEVRERRQSLHGFVFSPLRADDFFAGIFGAPAPPGLALRVYDGSPIGSERLLYASSLGGDDHPRYRRKVPLDVAARRWTLELASLPAFESRVLRSLVAPTLTSGLLVSFLLFAMTRSQTRAHREAERIAADLQHSRAALGESEERYRNLVEHSPEAIAVHSAGKVVYVNPAALRLMGASSPAEIVGRSVFDFVHPDSMELAKQRIGRLLAAGILDPVAEKLVRLDGRTMDVEILAIATTYMGNPAAQVILRDVTTRKRAEEERDRLRREFAAMLSHDIKTPLASILAFAHLVRERLPAVRDRDYLDRIESNAQRALNLAINFTDLAVIESGALDLRRVPVDVNEIVVRAAADQEGSARLVDVAIDTILDDRLEPLRLDVRWVERVIANLLSNAIKFTPPGRRVELRTGGGAGDATLTVSDEGPGMPPDVRDKLFGRFGGVAPAVRHSSGLGLFIAKTVVDAHGGEIHIDEHPGGGTAVRVTFRREVEPVTGESGAATG